MRLGIALRLAGEPETCACDFADVFGVSQPTVSQHLKVLRERPVRDDAPPRHADLLLARAGGRERPARVCSTSSGLLRCDCRLNRAL